MSPNLIGKPWHASALQRAEEFVHGHRAVYPGVAVDLILQTSQHDPWI